MWKELSYGDYFMVVALFSLYFVSGGTALGLKLASMVLALKELVDSADAADRYCADSRRLLAGPDSTSEMEREMPTIEW